MNTNNIKYPIDVLNSIGTKLGAETEKAYPIDALNEISKALGGTGQSKYPASALAEIANFAGNGGNDSPQLFPSFECTYNFDDETGKGEYTYIEGSYRSGMSNTAILATVVGEAGNRTSVLGTVCSYLHQGSGIFVTFGEETTYHKYQNDYPAMKGFLFKFSIDEETWNQDLESVEWGTGFAYFRPSQVSVNAGKTNSTRITDSIFEFYPDSGEEYTAGTVDFNDNNIISTETVLRQLEATSYPDLFFYGIYSHEGYTGCSIFNKGSSNITLPSNTEIYCKPWLLMFEYYNPTNNYEGDDGGK